tara:strand:+ start:1054 stop:2208 length:1155 start_codon:yes stop_codon:yes gene_type:complete
MISANVSLWSMRKGVGASEPNLGPSITSSPVTTGTTDTLYQYQVTATDPEGDALTFSLSVKPSGMTINATTGLIQYTPTAASTPSVTVVVTDTKLNSASQNYTINVIQRTYSINALVVAGGGAGPSIWAGGGGAGGMQALTQAGVIPSNSWTVTIGAGGAAGSTSNQGNNGSVSSIAGTGITTVSSVGGGGAGKTNQSGATGGSGGGGGSQNNSTSTNRGSGTSGQGNNGGNGRTINYFNAGGGGGGAGAVGANGTSTKGGNGGAGSAWLDGTTYAGGGGGSATRYNSNTSQGAGSGGSGGGGNGSFNYISPASFNNPQNGGANTGGGGGGSSGQSISGRVNASGGSGIVIIRYSGNQVGSGGTVSSAGGYTYHTFTSSGTYTT